MLRLFVLLALFFTPLTHGADISVLLTQAQANSVQAQYALGLAYQQGKDTTRSLPDAFYWFEKAAEQGHNKAIEQVAEAYLYGLGTDKDPQQALYWLTKLATLGQTTAQATLGDYYQKLGAQRIDAQDLAQVWYRIASAKDPQAEAKYTKILENKFNQQRAKQVASIKQLEQAIPTTSQNDTELLNNAQPSASSDDIPNGSGSVASDYLLLAGLLIIIFSSMWSMTLWRRRKQKKVQHQQDEKHAQQQLFNQQKKQLKKQKQQLETLFNEVSRLQSDKQKLTQLLAKKTQTPHSPQSPPQTNQNLAVACALFGFMPNQIPDEKAIKLRYKQLSKIYHPDMKGSEEEMKRLNSAVKIVIAHRKR
ncbi:hypothetical protein [Vibrio tritonius]|uniref:J domain-containing protein n=1 Tax=Vibrio tritonius TaxID=1435069 RepID=UPI00315CA84C